MTPEFNDRETMEMVGGILREIIDYGEMVNELQINQKLEIEYNLTEMLDELCSRGFWLFGIKDHRKRVIKGKESDFPVAIFSVVSQNDQEII